jgi:secreted PhoX family phosphatase
MFFNVLDINTSGSTPTATSTGIAYDTIYDRNGTIVTKASQINGGLTTTAGFNRFCSANFIKANTFGKGTGFKKDLFLIGEESGEATVQAFDPSTKTLYGLADLGYGGWENATVLNTGNKNKVAVLLGDDFADAPIYMYVGTQKNKGTVLEQNGLIGGKMYVWAADSGSTSSASLAEKTTTSGTWKEILVKDATKAGQTGYDALGYKKSATLRAEAKALGAFLGYRIEDVDANPLNGAQAAFNTTGGQTNGTSGKNDYYGSTWTIETKFKNGDPITGQLKHVYDGDATGKGKNGIRSQDNLAWSADGNLYINEDRATEATAGDFGTQEASIWKLDPITSTATRVAQVNRSGYLPTGVTDTPSSDPIGDWETSGIIDVSELFGKTAGSTFFTTVQAHGTTGGAITSQTLVEGGTIELLTLK